jgi:hypothetical protein
VVQKKLRHVAAAERMGICVRHVKRLVRAWKAQGDAGLVSKQRGRVSPLRMKSGNRSHPPVRRRGSAPEPLDVARRYVLPR